MFRSPLPPSRVMRKTKLTTTNYAKKEIISYHHTTKNGLKMHKQRSNTSVEEKEKDGEFCMGAPKPSATLNTHRHPTDPAIKRTPDQLSWTSAALSRGEGARWDKLKNIALERRLFSTGGTNRTQLACVLSQSAQPVPWDNNRCGATPPPTRRNINHPSFPPEQKSKEHIT